MDTGMELAGSSGDVFGGCYIREIPLGGWIGRFRGWFGLVVAGRLIPWA